ncbi:MAG TPA: gamma-glutamyltransferase, partial [Thermoanaerobaculia bacterium]|nr:gamma-glutamyltransferase [Thermoanaerobaculia bacterium]
GNTAAVTVSLGGDFGSGFLVSSGGFFLNDALASFSSGGVNAAAPGKRPLSSACPTIVLRGGKPYLVLGGTGGASIPTTIAQIYLRHRGGQEITTAVAEPRYHQASLPDLLEYEGKAPPGIIESLNEMGHAVALRPSMGSAHVMLFTSSGILSIADPRSHGAAGGF